jgi:phage repressor protein C with HTH and peptisase S24 domain
MNIIQRNLKFLLQKHRLNASNLSAETGVPQPTIHRILTGESKDPRTPTLEAIAYRFKVTADMLRNTDLQGSDNGEALTLSPMSLPFKQVRIAADLSRKEGPIDLSDPALPGYVEYPSRDKTTFALRVRGGTMRPRYRSGEFLIVEPSQTPVSGSDVLVVLKDGTNLLKELLFTRDDEITFSALIGDFQPKTISEADIQSIQQVVAILPPSAFYGGE